MNQYVPSRQQVRIAHALSRKFSQPWGWVDFERLIGMRVSEINRLAATVNATTNFATTPGPVWKLATAASNGQRVLRFVNRSGQLEWRVFENGRTDVLVHGSQPQAGCVLWFSLVSNEHGQTELRQLPPSKIPASVASASDLTAARDSVTAAGLELGMTRAQIHDVFAPLFAAPRDRCDHRASLDKASRQRQSARG